jgi:integrase
MAEILSFSTSECYERSKGFAMRTYLKRHPNGTYYFRRDIPKHLQPIIGQTAWSHSLRTKDCTEGKRKVDTETVRTNGLIAEAEKVFAAGAREPVPAPQRSRADDWQREHEEREAAWAVIQGKLDDEHEERVAEQEPHARRLRSRIKGSTARMAPEDAVVARILREKDEEIALLREHSGSNSRSESVGDSYRGSEPTPAPALPKSLTAPQRVSQGKIDGVSISGLYEKYATQPGISIRAATIKQWRSYIQNLIAFLGQDGAEGVTTKDLIRWREHLRTLTGRGGKPLSPKTINGSYLAAANVTFAYGVNQLLIDRNPMTDVQAVRSERKVKLRDRDFTNAERKAILRAALAGASVRVSDHRRLAVRWVPWLCAYTGARVNEVTQLRAEDVKQIDGVWTIHITPEAGGVKTDQARTVPIHEHLVAQGFLEVVKGKTGPLFYVATDAGADSDRGQHKRTGMWLAAWGRDEVGITDPNVAPNHGWRHTFKTICREAEIDESAADYMQGHAHKAQGRQYGSNTLPALSKQLAKFPRYSTEE